MTNGPYIVDETCLVFAKNIETENEKLRAENEKLRKALNGWQEWWELPWQDKRPDIAELIYRRAAAAIRESGE